MTNAAHKASSGVPRLGRDSPAPRRGRKLWLVLPPYLAALTGDMGEVKQRALTDPTRNGAGLS